MRIIIDDVYVERGVSPATAAASGASAIACSAPRAVLEGSLERSRTRGEVVAGEEGSEASAMTDYLAYSDNGLARGGEADGGLEGGNEFRATSLSASQQQQQSAAGGGAMGQQQQLRQRSSGLSGSASGGEFYAQQPAHDLSPDLGSNVSCSQNASWDPAGHNRFPPLSGDNDTTTMLRPTFPLGVGVDSGVVTQQNDTPRYGYAAAASLGLMQRTQRSETAAASSGASAAAAVSASYTQAVRGGGGGGGGGAPSTSGYLGNISEKKSTGRGLNSNVPATSQAQQMQQRRQQQQQRHQLLISSAGNGRSRMDLSHEELFSPTSASPAAPDILRRWEPEGWGADGLGRRRGEGTFLDGFALQGGGGGVGGEGAYLAQQQSHHRRHNSPCTQEASVAPAAATTAAAARAGGGVGAMTTAAVSNNGINHNSNNSGNRSSYAWNANLNRSTPGPPPQKQQQHHQQQHQQRVQQQQKQQQQQELRGHPYQQQQQLHQHAATHDRARYGHHGGGASGRNQRPSSRIGNDPATNSTGRGLGSGAHLRNGLANGRPHHGSATILAYPSADVSTRSQTPGAMHAALGPSSSSSSSSSTFESSASSGSMHARSRSDVRCDRERIGLAKTNVSASSAIGQGFRGGIGGHGLAAGSRLHGGGGGGGGRREMFTGNGNGNGGGDGGGNGDGGGGGSGGGIPMGFRNDRSQNEATSSSMAGSSRRGSFFTRRSSPLCNQQNIDLRSSYLSDSGSSLIGGGGDGGACRLGAMDASSSASALEAHQGVPGKPACINADMFSLASPPELRARNGAASILSESMAAMDLNASSSTDANANTHGPVSGGDHQHMTTALLPSPLPPATLAPLAPPMPKNSEEWLQNLDHTRVGGKGKDKSPGTPRTSRSSSMSSLASPSRLSALVGAGDRRSVCGLRSEAMVAGAMGLCPAPDCPGVGDCLPGAMPEMLVYEVMFKRGTRTFLLGEALRDENMSCGDFIKVEADRGEDLGTVHNSLPLSEYLHALYKEKQAKAAKIAENGGGGGGGGGENGASQGKKKRNKAKKREGDGTNASNQRQQQPKKEEEHRVQCPVNSMMKVLRPATANELDYLPRKAAEEAEILVVAGGKAQSRNLPMQIVDVEYQFDKHKLTLFFEAERRIDFRELVRDLYAVYKTRIWMQQVKDKDAPAGSGSGGKCPDNNTSSNNGSGGGSMGGGYFNMGPSLDVTPLGTADDAEHDSGYGSTGSSCGGGWGGARHGGGMSCKASAADASEGGAGSFDSRAGADAGAGAGGGAGAGHGRSGSLESEHSNCSAFSRAWPGEIGGGGGGSAGGRGVHMNNAGVGQQYQQQHPNQLQPLNQQQQQQQQQNQRGAHSSAALQGFDFFEH